MGQRGGFVFVDEISNQWKNAEDKEFLWKEKKTIDSRKGLWRPLYEEGQYGGQGEEGFGQVCCWMAHLGMLAMAFVGKKYFRNY